MSLFSHLHNPKEAAKLVAQWRKLFSSKTCMAPDCDHTGGSIISAHTLSATMLRKLTIDSHVYALDLKNVNVFDGGDRFKKLGIHDVSVFNGFCEKHDRELFSCLENKPFIFEPEQNFMLAYRTIAREIYLKRAQSDAVVTPEQFCLIHGISEPLEYSDDRLEWMKGVLCSAEALKTLKEKLDSYFVKKEWRRLVTKAIIFPKTPTIAATGVFYPFVDLNGNSLQMLKNVDDELSEIIFSLIPIAEGGAAIFSWLDTSINNAPEKFFSSIAQNHTSAIINVVLDYTENFAISPQWYDNLLPEKQNYIRSRALSFDTSFYGKNLPDIATSNLDDWGSATTTSF